MAVSKFTSWRGQHNYTDFYISTNYDVYADMSNGSTTPYFRIQNLRFKSNDNIASLLSSKLPFTLKIRINGTGMTYTFTTSSSQSHHDIEWDDPASYYYVAITDSRNITIPGNGQAFTINATITDKNNNTYTYVEHACGPKSNVISGTTSINTGAVATFTLQNSIQNTEYYGASCMMTYYFPTSQTLKTVNAYSSIYTPLRFSRNAVTRMYFVPERGNASAGEKTNSADIINHIEFRYYYFTHDDYFGAPPGGTDNGSYGGANSDNSILISRVDLPVTVTARTTIDSSLAPEVESIVQGGTYDDRVDVYGAGIQGKTTYETLIRLVNRDESYEDTRTAFPPYYSRQLALKYGSTLTNVTVVDKSSGSTVTKTFSPTSPTWHRYGAISLNAVVTNAEIKYTFNTTYGLTATYSDYVTVMAYSAPRIPTYRARRCSIVSSGSGSGYYEYDGNIYHVDDYGEYCLIEWAVAIDSINSINSKSFRIREPRGTGYYNRTISLSGYTDSGYYVVAADGEHSYNITFTAQDNFATTTRTVALSTVMAIMDCLNGGSGVAFGKVAELSNTVDIHRNWLLKMPNTIQIGNYSSGSPVYLQSWMRNTENRIQNIIDRRPYAIYHEGRFYNNLTAVSVPSSVGTTTMNNNTFRVTINSYVASAMLISAAVPVSRYYLKITFSRIMSFAAPTYPGTLKYPKPTVYIMSTKPTSVDQNTGVPNGTILKSQELNAELEYSSSGLDARDHYQYYNLYSGSGLTASISTVGLSGSVWIAITVASGKSENGNTGMNGYIEIRDMVFSV